MKTKEITFKFWESGRKEAEKKEKNDKGHQQNIYNILDLKSSRL